MTRTIHCSGCDRGLKPDDFTRRNKAREAHLRLCRECQVKARTSNRQNNIQRRRAYAVEHNRSTIAENRQRVYHYLTTHPCVDCGNADVRVLEFDHVRGNKKNAVIKLLGSSASWPTIKAEIAKCEVRCVNCHRIKTSERGGWWRAREVE